MFQVFLSRNPSRKNFIMGSPKVSPGVCFEGILQTILQVFLYKFLKSFLQEFFQYFCAFSRRPFVKNPEGISLTIPARICKGIPRCICDDNVGAVSKQNHYRNFCWNLWSSQEIFEGTLGRISKEISDDFLEEWLKTFMQEYLKKSLPEIFKEIPFILKKPPEIFVKESLNLKKNLQWNLCRYFSKYSWMNL